jgi:hypothetical protein
LALGLQAAARVFGSSMLILKRNPDARYTESYNVFEGRHVGRIYKAVSHAPRETPWLWGLEFHEWHGSDGLQYGNVATLEAAKQAFRAAWDRRPKAHGKSWAWRISSSARVAQKNK